MTTTYRRPGIKPQTMEKLMDFASPGQTPDGAIRELLGEQGYEV